MSLHANMFLTLALKTTCMQFASVFTLLSYFSYRTFGFSCIYISFNSEANLLEMNVWAVIYLGLSLIGSY